MLDESGFTATIDSKRGLDHGAWNPLLLMYPKADIPVLQLSVQPRKDAYWHYQLGTVLATLRDTGILIIGSGNLTHNLHEAFRGHHDSTPEWVRDFSEWVAKQMAENNISALLDWQKNAPHSLRNHPTPEHFLPLFVAMGAGHNDFKATRLHQETAMGVLAMDSYSFA